MARTRTWNWWGRPTAAACALSALVFGVTTQAQGATLIVGTDLEEIDAGSSVVDQMTHDVVTEDQTVLASLTNDVFFNADAGLYTYTHLVSPFEADSTVEAQFSTEFSVAGFNEVAGWSFAEAQSAGGTGLETDFAVAWNNETDGTIDWTAATGVLWEGDVTFFFQSHLAPDKALRDYSLTRLLDDDLLDTGIAPSFAPIPEPGTFAMLGLAGAAMLKRRQRLST